MEGDLVFCFVPFGLDLGSCCCCCWDDIFEERERERERGIVGVLLHLRSGCCFFLSEF